MSRLAVAFVALLAITVVGACGTSSTDGSARTDEIGTLTAALSATGPDGATYSLPSDARLRITRSSGALTDYGIPDGASFSTVLAAGPYTAALETPDGTWELLRAANGATSSVSATLTDPQPYSFTIAKGQTTSLVFHFSIGTLGPVTFSLGTFVANIQVDAGAPQTATQAILAANVSYDGELFTSPASEVFTLDLAFRGDWTPNPDKACVGVTAHLTSLMTTSSGEGPAVHEFDQSSGFLCVGDANALNEISLTLDGTVQSTVPLSNAATFEMFFEAPATSAVYDGTTLSLSALAAPMTLSPTSTITFFDSNSNVVDTEKADPPAPPGVLRTATLQLTP